MKEIERQATIYLTDHLCEKRLDGVKDKLCAGRMEWDGFERMPTQILASQPRFRHRCTVCERSDWLARKYPVVRYERIELDETPSIGVGAAASAASRPNSK